MSAERLRAAQTEMGMMSSEKLRMRIKLSFCVDERFLMLVIEDFMNNTIRSIRLA